LPPKPIDRFSDQRKLARRDGCAAGILDCVTQAKPDSSRAERLGLDIAALFARQFRNAVLPYPDVLRRLRIRRKAASLVTCRKWPGDDATGAQAAQLAMLRLLTLQRLAHRAATLRQKECAALLARLSLETCLVGMYCLYAEDAVARLSAANYRGAGRSVSYLSDAGLVSREAIESAVAALGPTGRDLDLRQVAEWLRDNRDLDIATNLYWAYYVPLSHFFVHANGFTLTRHVRPDDTLRQRAAYPWTVPAAARLADGCTGLLALHLAVTSGAVPGPLGNYAKAHLGRMVTPAVVLAFKSARGGLHWRRLPGFFLVLLAGRRYMRGPGRTDDARTVEEHLRQSMSTALRLLLPDIDEPEGVFSRAIDEYIGKILAEEGNSQDNPSAAADDEAR
jgi:hypothetical protein